MMAAIVNHRIWQGVRYTWKKTSSGSAADRQDDTQEGGQDSTDEKLQKFDAMDSVGGDIDGSEDDGMEEKVPETPHSRGTSQAGSQGKLSGQSSSISEKRDIFIHFEVLRAGQHKTAQLVWTILLLLSLAYFALMMYYRFQEERPEAELRSQHMIKLQTAVAVVLISLLFPMLAWFVKQLLATRRCDWSRRQRYIVTVAFLQICFQAVNLLFWLIPNAYVLANRCHYLDPLVNASTYIRFTCYNTVFALQVIHARNCYPKTRKGGKNDDASPDLDNPKLKTEGRRDPMYLDANPWATHWLVMIYWCLAQASIIYLIASGGPGFARNQVPPSPIYCTWGTLPKLDVPKKGKYLYPVSSLRWIIVRIIWATWLVCYLSWVAVFARVASGKLRRHPYSEYKFANLLMLWQRRLALWVEGLGIADVCLFYYHDGGLVAFVQQWFGQGTLQILTTATTALSAFYFLPMEPTTEEHYYQVWLQEFAWTQPGIARRRRAMLKHSPGMEARLRNMPLFCMETALKLLLWSDVVYECVVEPEGELGPPLQEDGFKGKVGEGVAEAAEPESQPLSQGTAKVAQDVLEDSAKEDDDSLMASGSEEDPKMTSVKVVAALSGKEALDLAMSMYDMTNVKVIHSTVTDTKAVLAWGDAGMVLAFRGTQSMVDACIDLKAWTVAHPPKRGVTCLGTRPLVHKGFLTAWSEVADRVGVAVKEVLDSLSESQREAFQVFVTGHSLGGALAVLAAFQIQERHQLPHICCYTYGAPRTGNAAFAEEYERLVPETFHIINDRDAVPKTGKLMGMYKRPGDRVLINQLGDIRVRPTIFEVNLHGSGYSVKQHFLVSYLDALGSIMIAQLFKNKALDGGLKGVTLLSTCPNICRLLASVGVDLPELVAHPPRSMKHTLKKKKGLCKMQNNLVAMMRELQDTPFVFHRD